MCIGQEGILSIKPDWDAHTATSGFAEERSEDSEGLYCMLIMFQLFNLCLVL